MKKGLTELVFILDRSGSMADLTGDTIGGFNSLIGKQKNVEGEALVTTVLFNQESFRLHDRVPLEKVERLTEKDYVASGCTALIDAIGETVEHIADVHKYIREEDRPEHTMFVITTDGLENASRSFSSDEVKKLVTAKKEEGWEFIFLGANIDAVETARHFGISEDRAVNYRNDSAGIAANFSSIGDAVYSFRMNKSVGPDWRKKIDEDFSRRGN